MSHRANSLELCMFGIHGCRSRDDDFIERGKTLHSQIARLMVLSAPGGHHVGPMNLAIRVCGLNLLRPFLLDTKLFSGMTLASLLQNQESNGSKGSVNKSCENSKSYLGNKRMHSTASPLPFISYMCEGFFNIYRILCRLPQPTGTQWSRRRYIMASITNQIFILLSKTLRRHMPDETVQKHCYNQCIFFVATLSHYPFWYSANYQK